MSSDYKYDKVMMETAKLWSKQSYCKRLQVGAVLAKDGRILITGYNGTVHNMENICECTEKFPEHTKRVDPNVEDAIACPSCHGSGEITIKGTPYKESCQDCNGLGYVRYIDKTNEFTVHAEMNVITYAAKEGIQTNGTTMYITHAPCPTCSKLIVQAGIKRVVYEDEYRKENGINFLKDCGVIIHQLSIK